MKKNAPDTSLADSLRIHLKKYFAHFDGTHFNSNLYEEIVSEVEKVLISETMDYCNNVQSKAANMLGVNRNTLRNKIKQLAMQE
jgi:Fis family transcriptional regulator